MREMTKIITPHRAALNSDLDALLRLIAQQVVRKHLATAQSEPVTSWLWAGSQSRADSGGRPVTEAHIVMVSKHRTDNDEPSLHSEALHPLDPARRAAAHARGRLRAIQLRPTTT